MQKHKFEGLVLRSRNLSEADKVFTIFTRQKGILSVFANGIRKPRSRRSGNMDSLNLVSIEVSQSGGYLNLLEVESLNSFKNAKSDLSTSLYAFYLAELLLKLLPEGEENIDIFDLAVRTMKKLDTSKYPAQMISSFELRLLSMLGYDLILDKCVLCSREVWDSWDSHKFSLDKGGLVCDKCGSFGFQITPQTACALFLLKSGKLLNDVKPDFVNSHEIIQLYIKEIFDIEFNTHKFFPAL